MSGSCSGLIAGDWLLRCFFGVVAKDLTVAVKGLAAKPRQSAACRRIVPLTVAVQHRGRSNRPDRAMQSNRPRALGYGRKVAGYLYQLVRDLQVALVHRRLMAQSSKVVQGEQIGRDAGRFDRCVPGFQSRHYDGQLSYQVQVKESAAETLSKSSRTACSGSRYQPELCGGWCAGSRAAAEAHIRRSPKGVAGWRPGVPKARRAAPCASAGRAGDTREPRSALARPIWAGAIVVRRQARRDRERAEWGGRGPPAPADAPPPRSGGEVEAGAQRGCQWMQVAWVHDAAINPGVYAMWRAIDMTAHRRLHPGISPQLSSDRGASFGCIVLFLFCLLFWGSFFLSVFLVLAH